MDGLTVVILFSIATIVALLARRFKQPYTVALVVAGLGLGSLHAFEAPHLTKDLLYTIFLPGLLFEAAFHLDVRRFLQNRLAILALALPGLVACIALTAVILVPVVGMLGSVGPLGMGAALVFGALIAATDPIAVVALFKTVGAPKRLAVLVEGESLLNDGTAVVAFTLVFTFVMGGETSVLSATIDFLRVVGMGLLVGGAIGYAVSLMIHQVDDPMIETTLTTIAAYGSFIVAERFHFSGVIATVAAGMFCGNHAARTGMSASTRVTVLTFWEYVAFALNSLVFLLIGFEVNVASLLRVAGPIVAAWLVVTLVRGAVTQLIAALLRRTKREPVSMRWANVLTWGGLRGALSMVLVLGLPRTFPQRELLVSLTFGVVVLSILVQGTTMGLLLRRLGLVSASTGSEEYERLQGIIKSSQAALVELKRPATTDDPRGEQVLAELRAEYAERIAIADAQALQLGQASVVESRAAATRRATLAEKDALVHAYRNGDLTQEVYDSLASDVDARLFEIDACDDAPEDPAHS